MKYQVEHEKKNSISRAAIAYSFYIYKQTNDEFFDCFPKISKDFRKISEDSPKVVESPDNRFRTFQNILEDCQIFPK